MQVRATKHDVAAWKKAAEAEGMTLSAWIRSKAIASPRNVR